MGIDTLKFGPLKRAVESALLASIIACGHIQKEVNADVNETIQEDFHINAPRLLKKGKIDHKEFFEKLNKVQEVYEVVQTAENPDSPIFLLMLDEHGSPEVEEEKLNNLREKLGIKFVGVEGWAGTKADKERGYDLVNAERELILKIREDKRFDLVGLEEPALQEKVMKKYFFDQYIMWLQANARVLEIESKGKVNALDKLELKIYKSVNDDQEWAVQDLLGRFGIEDDEEYDKFMYEILKENGVDWMEIKKKEGESDKDFAKRMLKIADKKYSESTFILRDTDALDQRSKAGAKIMFEEAKRRKASVGVIIFGTGHATQVIDELKKLGDCSIIII